MPFYSATVQRLVRELVVVEANSPDHARELIDEESDDIVILQTMRVTRSSVFPARSFKKKKSRDIRGM